MFKAIGQMFQALFILFSAAEKGAQSLDNLAGYAEEASRSFTEEARIEREKKLAAMKAIPAE